MIKLRRLRYTALASSVMLIMHCFSVTAQDVPEVFTPLPFEMRTDPVLQVASYYNALNLADYERAYSYWETPPDDASFETFSAGFADTIYISGLTRLPVYTDAGAGNIFASVPVLLTSVHADNSRNYFAGCITTHKVNVPEGDATEPDPNWRLRSAEIAPVETFDIAHLDGLCEQMGTLADFPENHTSPINLLTSYYGAVASGIAPADLSTYWSDPTFSADLEPYIQNFNTPDLEVTVRLDLISAQDVETSMVALPALVEGAIELEGQTGVGSYGGCYYVVMTDSLATSDVSEWVFVNAYLSSIEEQIANGPDITSPNDMPLGFLQDACAMG